MSVTLTSPRIRPDDNGYDVVMIGINYPAGRVVVRIRFDNGDTQDITFEDAKLTALRTNVPQFSGLRAAIESYIAATEANLGGQVI